MRKLLSKIYIIFFMALSVWFIVVIWNVTFGEIAEEYYYRKNTSEIAKEKRKQEEEQRKSSFQELILKSEERVKHYLGYRVLEETRIEGHFHHIDFEMVPDRRSYCVQCHGDMPHDKVRELRAFANMHAFFIGCETCHVRLEGDAQTGVFKWYDRTTGEIVPSPIKPDTLPGTYKAKILPFERTRGKLERIDTQERIDFVREYREREKTLTESQKSKATKMIHSIVSKQPYTCEDCHQQEARVIPFEELGYSKKRIDSIVSTEVVGMIKNYTKFYMPRLLHPGDADENTTGPASQQNAP